MKREQDMENLEVRKRTKVSCTIHMTVPANYAARFRTVIRDLLLEKIRSPTMDIIFSKSEELNVNSVMQLNLFDDNSLSLTNSTICPWSRPTLHRYMKSIGFIYGDRISAYVHTKYRSDIVEMRKNYLKWIKYYRQN